MRDSEIVFTLLPKALLTFEMVQFLSHGDWGINGLAKYGNSSLLKTQVTLSVIELTLQYYYYNRKNLVRYSFV